MHTLAQSPAFATYAVLSLLLVLNLLFLWGYSGATRGRTKTAVNPEDAERFHARLGESDPPEVARVLRAHRNAESVIHPFLLLGLVYVLAGGGNAVLCTIGAVFVAARYVHSWTYLKAQQPWRTISFVVSGLALIALMIAITLLLLK
ncbi:MAG TPA: MAPEG family protein [Solimonas sp.]|nr:MAPEG family protein [Solimonas sp.]